jgi:hypothetical protein
MASRPLPLEQLIGAPLRSIVLGQGIAARATAEFVSEVGFAPVRGREPTARTFDFDYVHPVPDPENPGSVVDTPTRVSVPLLTVVSIPNVRIAEATVSFGADIVDVKAVDVKAAEVPLDRPKATAAAGTTTLPAVTQLIGVYAAPQVEGAPGGPMLTISIKVVRDDAPAGLKTIVDLLTEGVRSRAHE